MVHVIMVPGTDNEPNEGITRHVFEVSKRIGREGFKVLNVMPTTSGSRVLKTVEGSYSLLEVPVPNLPLAETLLNRIDIQLGSVPYFLRYREAVRSLLVEFKEPFVLHTYSFCTIAQPARSNKLCRRLATVQGFGTLDAIGKGQSRLKTQFMSPILRRVYQNADRYTTESQTMIPMMVAFYGIDEDRISVVPHGVDTGFFSPSISASETKITESKFNLDKPYRVLFLGHLMKGKGLEVLLNAFKMLLAKRKDVLLILKIGRVSHYDEMLRHIATLGIKNNVRIISRKLSLDELKSLYKVSNAYVNYHLMSGHSTAVLEAMASGVPPIIHRDSPNADIVDQSCGILVETLDPEELAVAIESVIDDETYANRLSRNAMKRAVNEHDWDKVVVPKYVSVYKSLMEE